MAEQLKYEIIAPVAILGERPTLYAERLAHWYSANSDESHRKGLGIYFTPSAIARYMGALCRNGARHFVRVLDPASGTGILACAVCEMLSESASPPKHIELVCYEIDKSLTALLEAALRNLQRWLAVHRKVRLRFRIEESDFVLSNANALQRTRSEDLSFDAVICNPPYFKIAKSDPRAQACSLIVHGQPNIYGLFMAVGAAMLREGGRLAFITPRSYASGPYFKRFREYFFSVIRPTDIHVFESRAEAFANVLQETVITAGSRTTDWNRIGPQKRIRLTTSAGADDVETPTTRTLPLSDVLKVDCDQRLLYFPSSKEHDRVQKLVNKWEGTLHRYGWEISTGPVVAFRAASYLRDRPVRNAIPLLWLQNVKSMSLTWPTKTRKPQYVVSCDGTKALVLPNRNYVILRRFSAKEDKRRITAAPHIGRDFNSDQIGLENHLNFIHKPRGQLSSDEAFGLAALLNSELMDRYFRIASGNTQVSATEMRAIRLPSLASVRRIGERVRAGENMDSVVNKETGYGT
jgi:adenine-specific DNA-methyltransferase